MDVLAPLLDGTSSPALGGKVAAAGQRAPSPPGTHALPPLPPPPAELTSEAANALSNLCHEPANVTGGCSPLIARSTECFA